MIGKVPVAARAAQNAFVRSAGHELAAHGVRLNAIAQNFVENDTYYPPSIMENERFRDRLREMTGPRQCYKPIVVLVCEVNRYLRGWLGYFARFHRSSVMASARQHVFLSVRKHLQRRSQRSLRPPKGMTWDEFLYARLGVLRL